MTLKRASINSMGLLMTRRVEAVGDVAHLRATLISVGDDPSHSRAVSITPNKFDYLDSDLNRDSDSTFFSCGHNKRDY